MKLSRKLVLCWRILRQQPSYTEEFLKRELPRPAEDGPGQWIFDGLEELVLVFSTQGHSGTSAPWMRGLLNKVLAHKPLSPLTGADDEWAEVCPGMWQNKRFSEVFKGSNGAPYWAFGRVFEEPNGVCFTSSDSRVPITFPFTVPDAPEYVLVQPEG